MSLVADHICQLDGQIDRLQVLEWNPESQGSTIESGPSDVSSLSDEPNLARVLKLQAMVGMITTASSARKNLPPKILLASLDDAVSTDLTPSNPRKAAAKSPREEQLEWLVVSKVANQTYGIIMNMILDLTIPLSRDIEYWDDVLSSYWLSSLYAIQTTPIYFWDWASSVGDDIRHGVHDLRSTTAGESDAASSSIAQYHQHWKQFYSLVKKSVHNHSANVRSTLFFPLIGSRQEVRVKRSHLKKLRVLSACGLGMLMDEGMAFGLDDEGSIDSMNQSSRKEDWRRVVFRSVSLMGEVLRDTTLLGVGTSDLEEQVSRIVDAESMPSYELTNSPNTALIKRLKYILQNTIPMHVETSKALRKEFGRPSRLVRYWLPGLAVFLSSSTLLRIFFNRRVEIITWIQDFGATSIDFWNNWVVEPTKKVIGTIRHDKDSEIALMSKESLEGDRASLERMVVDFATDNPNSSSRAPLTETEIADVRAKVKEGDLTPVLRAYEQDLRKPFVGTIRGDLIRALLIQIQKTKVDVEVAVGGIDNLLKSQELVFGFVGLTPGVLVCLGLARWLSGTFQGRRGRVEGKKQGGMTRILRNIDRILVGSNSPANGVLSYKDHGMLLCETHLLRQQAQNILPGEIYNDFLEDINSLTGMRTGVDRQAHIVNRIRWAYSRWLQ